MYLITSGTKPFIYIGHPKTGSMSTRQVLMGLGAEEIFGQHGIKNDIVQEVIDQRGIVCSTCRLPYSLIVSWYHHDCICGRGAPETPPTLYEYLVNALATHPYLSLGTLFTGWLVSNCTIRFEHGMGPQLNFFLQCAGLPHVELPHINATQHQDYQHYYGHDSVALVATAFHRDFERYGYHFC